MKTTYQKNFPNQLKERTDQWWKDCIDSAIDLVATDYHGIRKNFHNKVRNYNLANDIFDFEGLRNQLVPLFAKDSKYPVEMQHYPIAIQKIDLLVGEELKRPFNFTARITNDDAITQKEEEKDAILDEFFREQFKNQSQTEEEFAALLKEKVHYINTTFQDKREKLANQILQYYWYFLDLKEIFNRGFQDLLLVGEEIYRIDVIGNEPLIIKCNPLNVTVVGGNSSPFVEDADIIIEDGYYTPADIVDSYYDELSQSQVKKIENNLMGSAAGESSMGINQVPEYIMVDAEMHAIDAQSNVRNYPTINDNGEIRVSRVVWKSRKRIKLRTYFDEMGEVQQDIVSNKYKLREDLGDIEVTTMVINEALEGTRIGDDHDNIYVKMQPLPVQNRPIDNISKCSLGYVGVYANVNTNEAMSLMDRLYPFQKLYNLFMNKLNFLYIKYKGPMYNLDTSRIPDKYETEEWLYYAEMLGWKLDDPFNEGTKGQSLGKIAGNMQQGPGVVDANLYSIIQQTIEMLNYIEMQAGSISGISKAREGQIHQSEAVSNVTREINQSSHITEKWFSIHDQVKRKVLSLFLETAKYAFRNKNKKAQYILDDSTIKSLTIDGEMFNEATYDVQIMDTSNVQELFNTMKQLSHAAMQNDMITMSQLMDIYTDNSVASIKNKLKQAEQDKMERDSEQAKEQNRLAELQMQQQAMEKEQDNEVKLLMQARELQTNIMIELAKLASKEDISDEELRLKEKLTEMELENDKLIEEKRIALDKDKINAIRSKNTTT